jgi:hypothetical protein
VEECEDLLVELRGLEPLTPCLQNSADLSRTVPDVGLVTCTGHVRPARFGVVATGCGYRTGRDLVERMFGHMICLAQLLLEVLCADLASCAFRG